MECCRAYESAGKERAGDDLARRRARRDLGLEEEFANSLRDQRSPRSLSGARVAAGTRTMLGCPGRSTALAMMVAAASAIAARSASTVTASAMPSEKLRPRQPLVAIPRTGCPNRALRFRKAMASPAAPPCRDKMLSRGEMQRDVSAVVYVCPRKLAAAVMASRISSATAPATAAIGVRKVRLQ